MGIQDTRDAANQLANLYGWQVAPWHDGRFMVAPFETLVKLGLVEDRR